MLQLIHAAFHRPNTKAYQRTETFIWTLVLVSIALLVAEPFIGRPPWADISDRIVLGIFGLEIILRVGTHRPPGLEVFKTPPLSMLRTHLSARLRFLLKPMMLIDLATVLAVVPELRGLRALRFLRLLRTWRVFRYGNPFHGLIKAFETDRLLWAFAFTVLATETIFGGLTLYLVEADAVGSVGQGMWWALVTITTVGYGDVVPQTGAGRVVAGFLMVGGMFTLALFAGVVGHSLLNAVLSIREEQFRMSAYVNHVIVCGYTDGARLLLSTLADELDLEETRVVLFGPGARPTSLSPDFAWVSGDPTKESELDKVRLTHASSVLVVGNREVSPSLADATSILTVFTLRSYMTKQASTKLRKKPLRIVAEVLDSENSLHAEAAGAEAIESRRLGFSLLSHTLVYPGVGELTSKVIGSGAHNFYVGKVPSGLIGHSFGELAQGLRTSLGILAIGLHDPESGEQHINPADEMTVGAGFVVYLAERPVLESP